MNSSIEELLTSEQQLITEAITSKIESLPIPKRLKDSVLYSVQAGGKRIRPILMKWTVAALGGNIARVYPAAVALEMIHTYSLIHDDLPSMDDDKFRRGQLTNHKKFDEATAILAGDGLLTNSFFMVSNSDQYTPKEKSYLISLLAEASGLTGMVAGQYLDMQAENQEITIDELEEIHRLKTGGLISFAIETGGFIAGVTNQQQLLLKDLGDCLGLIFQIQDDILDVEGDQALLGKQVGSDVSNEKSTYTSILGVDGAKQHKERYVQKMKGILSQLHLTDSDLAQLCHYISERNQ
ncbi:polyprenyl synthetase family protein [Gracilibacillus timonensis]|uniref:polyprenyl synthetase family protein n=1 Tax=Gracilibacillus timonensis TaxID=1816696 RepID=UPI000825D332|nr:farnesyl diphosphate synthase [Gracilibacillus timonensis]